MKKVSAVLLFIVFFSTYNHGQSIYSKENLQTLSENEFAFYSDKAIKLKKTGTIMTLAGLGSSVTGIYLFIGSWGGDFGGSGTASLGLFMFLGGFGATIIGLPVCITGSIRVKKMDSIIVTSIKGFQLDIQPDIQYNQAANNYNPAIKLTLTF